MNCLNFVSSRRRILVPLLCAAIVGLMPRPSQAAPKYGTSLDWAPADAAFYTSSLRLREQWEIVTNSNAWKKLMEMPSVQTAVQSIQFLLAFGPGAQVRPYLEDPAYEDWRGLLLDALSNEAFVFGDKSSTDFLQTMSTIFSAIQMQAGLVDPGDSQTSAQVILNSLNAHVDKLATPGLVIGFKVTDKARAAKQIDELKDILEGQLAAVPQLEGRFKKQSVGGSDFLVLELDGGMIDIPWEDYEQEAGQYDKLKGKLKNLKAAICIGVRDDYLLVAIEPSVDAIGKIGTGAKLSEAKELQPLAKFADRKLISVSYLSKRFVETLSNTDQQVEEAVNMIRQALTQTDLEEDAQERIGKDLQELGDDLKKVLPKPGANMSFSFLTDRGVEGYGYDWGEDKVYDGSKPLSLLDHVGGNPLLAYVARGKYRPEDYQLVQKWVKKGYQYFEEFGVPSMDDDAQETFKKIKEIGTPLIKRLDKATGELLMPALADGQSGLVLDAKLISSKWFSGMKQDDQPLPMIELAVVFGVSDAGMLKKAIDEYKSIADDLVEQLKKEVPDVVPADYTIPKAETREVKTAAGTGTIYFYKLPEEAGVDAQLTPNAGLSDRVAVLSVSPKQSARVLADTPLKAGAGGPLADRKKAMSAAMYFDWAGTVDALTPWADYAVKQVMASFSPNVDEDGNEKPANEDDPMTKQYMEQVHTVLSVLKCLRTYESASYPEAGATVTHSVTEFKDVE
jgi:hypothetical protein